jgi:diadenosine tetraphosphatase ApaH/serine/threonine PP2A family protein phosphatase
MKTAVISCIHGNYEALNAVLSDIDDQGTDQIYCLGDLVGYGPHPNAVVEMIRSLDIPTCQGCWDEDIVEGLNACECSYPSLLAEARGKRAHEWTDQIIHPEVREYLAQLPLSLRADTAEGRSLCFVHGSPHNQHEYLLPELDAFVAMERVLAAGADILFCGHTHVPYVRSLEDGQLQVQLQGQVKGQIKSQVKGQVKGELGQPLSFTAPLKRIVNAGSVGEPRHGRPNATYTLYHPKTDRVEFKTVRYGAGKGFQAAQR